MKIVFSVNNNDDHKMIVIKIIAIANMLIIVSECLLKQHTHNSENF